MTQSETRTPRLRRLLGSIALTAVAALGLGGLTAAPALASAAPAVATPFLSGSYEGACNTTSQGDFAHWRGVANSVVLDGLDSSHWSFFENPTWWMDCYRSAGTRVSYSLPLLIDPNDTLQMGAAGDFNSHFATLAQNLVANGEADAILRPGWELNGGWYRWAAYKDPASFIAYWRNIVTVMRAVPGQHFTFTWTVSNNSQIMAGEQAWPGDAYVDQVGVDVYDATWAPNTYPYPANDSASDIAARQENAWNWYETSDHGLDFWSAFAAAHGKPLSFPEWGLVTRDDGHGGGDDPVFVQHVHDFIASHGVVSAIYFDYDGDLGDSRLRVPGHEAAAAAFLRLFGPGSLTAVGGPASSAAQTVTATVTASASSTVKSVVTPDGSPTMTPAGSAGTTTAAPATAVATATAKATATATVAVPTITAKAVAKVKGAKAKAKALARLRAQARATALAHARSVARAKAHGRAQARAHALAAARAHAKAAQLARVHRA